MAHRAMDPVCLGCPCRRCGQYENAESGWVYNRFRYYNATFGMYNAQDPLGVGPNIANPRGYVGNPTTWMDPLGLHAKSQKTSKIEASPESRFVPGNLVI